jgi:GDPmannose 4,6-dehydratase
MLTKNALITGVTGQDGFFLSQILIDHGYHVVGTTRNIETVANTHLARLIPNSGIKVVECDLLNGFAVENLLSTYRPNIIFHLAAESSVARSFLDPNVSIQSSIVVTTNLLQAINKITPSVSMVHAASSECFGKVKGKICEETQFSPVSPYGVGKCASSEMVRVFREGYGLCATNAFLFNHESTLRNENFVTKKILKHAYDCSIGNVQLVRYGNLSIIRDWGLAREYMKALFLVGTAENNQEYVIGRGEGHSLRSFLDKSFRFYDLDYHDFVDETEVNIRPSEVNATVADPRKIFMDLGWRAKSSFSDLIAELSSEYARERLKSREA